MKYTLETGKLGKKRFYQRRWQQKANRQNEDSQLSITYTYRLRMCDVCLSRIQNRDELWVRNGVNTNLETGESRRKGRGRRGDEKVNQREWEKTEEDKKEKKEGKQQKSGENKNERENKGKKS